MHEQSRHNQAVQPRDWSHHYFTPGDSDKCASVCWQHHCHVIEGKCVTLRGNV